MPKSVLSASQALGPAAPPPTHKRCRAIAADAGQSDVNVTCPLGLRFPRGTPSRWPLPVPVFGAPSAGTPRSARALRIGSPSCHDTKNCYLMVPRTEEPMTKNTSISLGDHFAGFVERQVAHGGATAPSAGRSRRAPAARGARGEARRLAVGADRRRAERPLDPLRLRPLSRAEDRAPARMKGLLLSPAARADLEEILGLHRADMGQGPGRALHSRDPRSR